MPHEGNFSTAIIDFSGVGFFTSSQEIDTLPSVVLLVYNSIKSDQFVCQMLANGRLIKNWNTLYTDVCPGSPNLHRHFLANKNIWGSFTENRDGAPMTGREYILGIHYMAKLKFSTVEGITSASLIKLRDA